MGFRRWHQLFYSATNFHVWSSRIAGELPRNCQDLWLLNWYFVSWVSSPALQRAIATLNDFDDCQHFAGIVSFNQLNQLLCLFMDWGFKRIYDFESDHQSRVMLNIENGRCLVCQILKAEPTFSSSRVLISSYLLNALVMTLSLFSMQAIKRRSRVLVETKCFLNPPYFYAYVLNSVNRIHVLWTPNMSVSAAFRTYFRKSSVSVKENLCCIKTCQINHRMSQMRVVKLKTISSQNIFKVNFD